MAVTARTVYKPGVKPLPPVGKPELVAKIAEVKEKPTILVRIVEKKPAKPAPFIAPPIVQVNEVRAAEVAKKEIKPVAPVKSVSPVTPDVKAQTVAPVETIKTDEKMGWKPKTIAGKILKGAVIAGGTALALGSGVGAIAGAVGGTGLLAGAAAGTGTVVKTLSAVGQGAGKLVGGVAKGTVNTLSKVGTAAVNLVTGTTQAERKQVREVKNEAKAAQDQLDQVQRLINAGADEAKARSMVGLTSTELPELNGKVVPGSNNMLMYAGLTLAALFLLPKILKR